VISAHRLGVGWSVGPGGLRQALDELAALGIDYVEFDLQRCVDGVVVAVHDATVTIAGRERWIGEVTFAELAAHLPDLFRYDDLLGALAATGLGAHIDLKFTSPSYADPERVWEVQAVARAVQVLGVARVVATTKHAESVLALRTWADQQRIALRVGLSLGTGTRGLPLGRAAQQVWGELFPERRFAASRANVMVAHYSLARLTLARFARRRGLPLLVWTVDSPRGLAYWLRPGRAWLVTTNRPLQAVKFLGTRDRHSLSP
jgi:glycerophosphoryl diester phosphodiesterase